MKFFLSKLGEGLIALVLISSLIYPQDERKGLSKTSASYLWPFARMNVNNISTLIYADGTADFNNSENSAALVYPKGSGKTAAYESGFLWGGVVNKEIRVSGSYFRSGLRPGRILSGSVPEDSSKARIYRVRRDYKTAKLSSEINDKEGTESEIRQRYDKDWTEWPAFDGAPYEDVDQDGKYDPSIDIPGEPGVDETIWFVANDLDKKTSLDFLGSLPTGIEMQCTVYAFRNPGPVNNMIFKRYKLINKSTETIDSMYVMLFSDFDIGDAMNDFLGCDTLLNLGYTYNATPADNVYGEIPPAGGFVLLQGPAVKGSPSDTAYMNGRRLHGMKNLPMTSVSDLFMRFVEEPDFVQAPHYYSFMQGKNYYGVYYHVPAELGGGVTMFPYSGDPVKKSGFIDGIIRGPDDRRMGINSGPFTMTPGDTQEVAAAEIMAGATYGISNIGAVSVLKKYTLYAKEFYNITRYGKHSVKPPLVTAAGYNKEILLNWGEDQAMVSEIESGIYLTQKFEGYNVYQLPRPGADISEGKRIAVFDVADSITIIYGKVISIETGAEDLVAQQFGRDSGIQRYLMIKKDAFTNLPLINGNKYYFAVTVYTVNPEMDPSNLESVPAYVEAVPHSNDPGVVYNSSFGDTLKVTHTSGQSNAAIVPIVIDPGRLTGHEYMVEFDTLKSKTFWKVTDITKEKIILSNQTAFSEKDGYPIADGILFKVISTPHGVKPDDKYTMNSIAPQFNTDLARAEVDRINVFPNPYYAVNPQELNRYQRFVTFNHLPVRATIRIYDVAGQLIRTVYKNSPGQFATWDLLNEHNFQASSGIYLVHIEMPELGKTKILKLAIIQEEIIPERY